MTEKEWTLHEFVPCTWEWCAPSGPHCNECGKPYLHPSHPKPEAAR